MPPSTTAPLHSQTTPYDRWALLRAHLPKYRAYIALGVISAILEGGFSVSGPYLIKIALDDLAAGRLESHGIPIALMVVGLAVVGGAFLFLNRRTIIWMSRKLEYDLRNAMFERLLRQPMSFFHERRIGDLMANLTNDLEGVRQMIGPGVMYLVNTLSTTLFAVGIMFVIAPKLTLYTILPMPILAVVVARISSLAYKRYLAIQEQFAAITVAAQENLAGVRVIKAYGQEPSEIARFRTLGEEYVERNMRLARLQGFMQPLLFGLGGLVTLVALLVGGRQLVAGEITIGALVTSFIYISMLVWPVIAFGWVMSLYQRGVASLDRVNALFQVTPEYGAPIDRWSDESGAYESGNGAAPAQGRVEFRNLTFCYPAAPHALADISLILEPERSLGVIGPVAAGKSTLAALIARLYEPPRGTLLVDGRDVLDWDLRALRKIIGYVPQEAALFSDTLAENIRYGAPDAGPDLIASAAATAAIDREIAGFSGDYETIVGERGVTLSGGQKQRISIARATLTDPRILILDDATSAVDTETESRIQGALREVRRRRATIVISHRVSSVKDCDEVIYLERGRIVERGSHATLVTLGGHYADLVRMQALEEALERE